ncbi:MAG: hypothetical protein SO176_00450 [Bacilli bacterium]|nr:hypothetical protein [Bacilli bacterium]
MLYKNVDLEKRGENEPKFNPKNKTDRKIAFTILILLSVLLLILGFFIFLYLTFQM